MKCDEGKQRVQGQEEPRCNNCTAAGLGCEWKGGPIPRRSTCLSSTKRSHNPQWIEATPESNQSVAQREGFKVLTVCSKSSIPQRLGYESHTQTLQAANSLILSAFDRDCISYLQNSSLVVLLGKHWPWSTISYAWHRIAVNEPMVMSMILASTAREIRRSQLYDQEALSDPPSVVSGELNGSMHYGRALSSLRHALTQGVTSPDRIEAVYMTLWLMIDYENRFGNGASAINIHIRGVQSMLQNHIVPLLQSKESQQGQASIAGSGNMSSQQDRSLSTLESPEDLNVSPTSHSSSLKELGCTSVPLFFLWTLYFFTPGALFSDSGTSKLDTDIFQFFFGTEAHTSGLLTLPELYRISRQSPSLFWGDSYSMSAQLDDVENLPGLALYHQSHVIQSKITELFRSGSTGNVASGTKGFSPCQLIVDELHALSTVCLTRSVYILLESQLDAISPRRVLTSDPGVQCSSRFRSKITILRHRGPAPPGPGNQLLGRNYFLRHNRVLPPLLPGPPKSGRLHANAKYPYISPGRGIPGPRAKLEATSEPASDGRADHLATACRRHRNARRDIQGLGVDSTPGAGPIRPELQSYQRAV